MNDLLDHDARLHMEAVLAEVQPVFTAAMTIMGEPDRKGAALIITNMDAEYPLLFYSVVGELTDEKYEKYCNFAGEKAERLRSRRDVSSYQGRDPDDGRWGGAVKGSCIIVSISGFPELWDEAIALTMLVKAHSMDMHTARGIAQISNNPYLEPLVAQFSEIAA